MDNTARLQGYTMLNAINKSEKFCKTMEKYIYRQTLKEDEEDQLNFYFRVIYQNCGTLLKNLDQKDNTDVLKKVMNGCVGWNDECYDSIRVRIEEHDEYIVNPFEVVEGIVECPKCHNNKTWSNQKQLRGGDEAMTRLSKCVTCGHEWSFSG